MADDEPQRSMFDLSGKEINPDWIDPGQALVVPANPLHVKAHKLQVLLARLDKQASRNGAQFNSANYLAILNEYTRCVQMINEGKTAHDMDEGELGENRQSGRQAPLGDPASAGVVAGISADNPLAG